MLSPALTLARAPKGRPFALIEIHSKSLRLGFEQWMSQKEERRREEPIVEERLHALDEARRGDEEAADE